jgi:ParB family chromosome partitioning protein
MTMELASAPLTATELDELDIYEATIEKGLKTFVDVGQALASIRDRKLYRETHGTFEEYCRERWQLARSTAYQLMDASAVVENVRNCGQIEAPVNESQARPLTQLEPEQQREAWAEAVDTAPGGKVTAKHVQEVVDKVKGKPHVANNSGNNEWYTPPQFIDAAKQVMGDIDLDPASSDLANEIVEADSYYTIHEDGLKHPWFGRVWMNPPYAQPYVAQFCEKLNNEVVKGSVDEAIVLVNNATETGWFQSLFDVYSAICFPVGRIRFLDTDGNPGGAPLQGQALIYIGKNVDDFADAFRAFGEVVYAAR